ncbi:hypothetical protein FRC01_001746 [Tulasnella sp. 417]|nr:hypothetical protein FRC01_001746 [Tulasnella sp. 417]
MTTSPTGLPDDQRINDYLKLELEFANEFAAKVVQAHPEWQSYRAFWSPVKSFLGVFFAAITEWKKMVSPSPQEEGLEEDSEAGIDDPTDSAYQENWMPTSLYRWAYLTLTFRPIDLEDDELRDRLVVRMFRTQEYDAELLGPDYHKAYPSSEGLLSRSPSPAPEDQQKANPALIHQLPLEILSDVFVRAHDEVLYFPIIFSHVDSRFRTIAESTASLWTKIDVNLPLPLVELYLKHSNTARLDIWIDLGSGGRRQNAASRLGAFLAVVAEHRERVVSLRMSAFNPRFVDDMVKAMMRDLACTIGLPGSTSTPMAGAVPKGTSLAKLGLGISRPDSGAQFAVFGQQYPSPCFGPARRPHQSTESRNIRRSRLLHSARSTRSTIRGDSSEPHDAPIRYGRWGLHDPPPSHPSHSEAHLLETVVELRFQELVDQLEPLPAMLLANPQLQSLDLCKCLLQPAGWRDVFGKAGSLKDLRMRSCELEPTDIESLFELGVGEDGEQRMLPRLEHLVLENVSDLSTGDVKRIITNRPTLRSLELRGWDGSHVTDEDVHFMREALECFILETFYKDSGALEEEEVDEGSEESSSTGTPSVGSWLSGDDEVVGANLVFANSWGK